MTIVNCLPPGRACNGQKCGRYRRLPLQESSKATDKAAERAQHAPEQPDQRVL